jgi:methyltransferase (TIGR00027 family)
MISQGSTAIISGLKLQFEKEQKNTSKKEEDKMAAIDPRKMALQIAGLRANETHLPADERVFEDPFAEFFFREEIRKMFQDPKLVKAELAKYEQMMPGVNGAIVARIRFIDEYLRECISNNFKQLVIIGAGYDTRAYRIEGLKENLNVFEVDHPITQEVKVKKIKEIFNQLPDHVTYVPVVFGQDRLDQKLSENGYQPELKTLFIVEGLLMYIAPPAVDALLSFITMASGPESAVVADFFDTTVVDGTSPLIEAQVLRKFVESEGSSLQFGIEKEKFKDFFIQRGFRHVIIVNAAAYKKDCFTGESSNRTVSAMFNFVKAAI